jgi:hypothetical protein
MPAHQALAIGQRSVEMPMAAARDCSSDMRQAAGPTVSQSESFESEVIAGTMTQAGE